MPLPPIVFSVGFDENCENPQCTYVGSNYQQAVDEMSYGVDQGTFLLGYVFRHPNPDVIFRGNAAARKAASEDQPAETAPASPS